MQARTAQRACAAALLLAAAPTMARQASAETRDTPDPLRSTLFLAPERFETAPGVDLPVALSIGDLERADPLPWPETDWLFVRGGGRQWNVSATPAGERTAGEEAVDLPMPEHGAAMIGADFEPATETWTSEQLRTFFRTRGDASFDVDRFAGRDDIRVQRRRSAVAIVRVRDGLTEGMPAPPAMTKAGLTSEIRLDSDPTVLAPGDTLHVRLYAGRHSRKGVAVFAHGEGGETHAVPVDGYGRCDVPIDVAGLWRLEFHYAELAPTDQPGEDAAPEIAKLEDPEVTLYTAALTFTIGGRP